MDKKKTIVIISELFGPFQNIGAIKFTKIAKYLSRKKEYKIVVFTRKNSGIKDPFLERDVKEIKRNGGEIYSVYAGDDYLGIKGNIIKRMVRFCSSRISRAVNTVEKESWIKGRKESKLFVKNAIKIFHEINIIPYAIISTYYDWGGHAFASEIKKCNPEAIWIADFRDPISSNIKEGKYRRLADDYSINVSKQADYITVVSKGMVNNLKLANGVKPIIATNGFDFEDTAEDIEKSKVLMKSDKLRLVYAGSLYRDQSFEPLFSAINELIKEGLIDEKKIEIIYAGNYGKRFINQAAKEGLSTLTTDLGILPRDEANLLLNSADIILLATWNSIGDEGVLSGKFVSDIAFQKKMICIVMGNKSDSEIKQRMRRLNCGFCYENANQNNDYELLKKEIFNDYSKKENAGEINQNYNMSELVKYDLKYITGIYEKLINI